jgi:methylated-DNA-[protein]-cysteine S-methyltransferase
MTAWTRHETPLGTMILAAESQSLIGTWFADQAYFSGPGYDWREEPGNPLLVAAIRQLDAWFTGRRRKFDLPIAPHGTPFQESVWGKIATIGFHRRAATVILRGKWEARKPRVLLAPRRAGIHY